jgi:DNA-3-methyladenine glycosylase II
MAKIVITYSGTKQARAEIEKAVSHLRRDPVLARIIARIGPCQLRPRREYFLVLCDSIISQQLSTRVAGVLLERFRSCCTKPGRRYPRPEDVLACSTGRLRRLGLSYQKISYLKDLARHFVERKIDPYRFHALSDEEIIGELVAVKGVGRWTAEMFLIFSLCRLDVWPVDDLGIKKAVQREYGLSGKAGSLPAAKQLVAFAETMSWRPYRSIVSWYLWRSQSTPNASTPRQQPDLPHPA